MPSTGREGRRLLTQAERIWYAGSFAPRKIGRLFGPEPWGTSALERSSLWDRFCGSISWSVASRLALMTLGFRSRRVLTGMSWKRPGYCSLWQRAQYVWSSGCTPRANSLARLTARAEGRSRIRGVSGMFIAARMCRRSDGFTSSGRATGPSATSPPARTSPGSRSGGAGALAPRCSRSIGAWPAPARVSGSAPERSGAPPAPRHEAGWSGTSAQLHVLVGVHLGKLGPLVPIDLLD